MARTKTSPNNGKKGSLRHRMMEQDISFPLLKSVELMSAYSGIGENKLRELIDTGEIQFVQYGNKKLLADDAIWEWYEKNKIFRIKESQAYVNN